MHAALYQQLAAKKLSRFREFAAIYPEACFVLIGDNGQVRRRGSRLCPMCSMQHLAGPGV